MSPPGLYFVPDRDGDDKPDGPPEVVFDGFGYKESRHNLANGFTWGPDGWLYGGHGRTSPSDVGRPGTPAEKRVHCDGGVYRIHPDQARLRELRRRDDEPVGRGLRRLRGLLRVELRQPAPVPHDPGGPLRAVAEPAVEPVRLRAAADHRRPPALPRRRPARLRVGTADTLALGGGHAHCGTLVYLGGSFPADYRNTVFMCNIHGHRVNRDILKRMGSGYVASHGKDFAISADPWFMGVTLRTGPDGSVFVSDWSDTGECHTYKPDTKTGRIFKISYGKPDRVAGRPVEEDGRANWSELQTTRNEWYVRHARRLLQERAASRVGRATRSTRPFGSMLGVERDRRSRNGCGPCGPCT